MVRSFLHNLTIGKYLTAVAVLITAIVGLLFLMALLVISYNSTLNDARERGQGIADILAFNLQAPLAFNDTESAGKTLTSVVHLSDVQGVSVLDAEGVPFATWGDSSVTRDQQQPYLPSVSVAKRDVVIGNEILGSVAVALSLRSMYVEYLTICLVALALWLTGLWVALRLSRSLNRRVTEPLQALDAFMTRAAQTESFDGRVTFARNDELGHVASALNNLLDRVEDRDNRLSIFIEELKNARDAAEASTRAKSSFLANMSHEVRTPMNGIVGLIDLIRLEGLNAQQESWVDSMNGSAEALLTIIDDILDFTRIEAGQLQIKPTIFPLAHCTAGIEQLFAEQMKTRGLSFGITIAPGTPTYIAADQGRLRQLLLNLVGNAFKFTNKGSIRVSVSVETREVGTQLKIEVVDTGIGIAEDERNIVFSRFQQVDAGLTRQYGGAGLGLSICSQLVALMGGTLDFESTKGEGSRFWFEIPTQAYSEEDVKHLGPEAVIQVAPTRTNTPTPKKDSSGISVLVAEDSEVNQFIIKELLKKLGADVTLTSNGQEAVDAAQTASFDVVLMDISMPVKDGLEATREILAAAEHSNWRPYIVGLSAHAMPGDEARALETGMQDYLTKPISLEALKTALQKIEDASSVKKEDK